MKCDESEKDLSMGETVTRHLQLLRTFSLSGALKIPLVCT